MNKNLRRRFLIYSENNGGSEEDDKRFWIFKEGNRNPINGVVIQSYGASYDSGSGAYKISGNNGYNFISFCKSATWGTGNMLLSKSGYDASNYTKLCIECSAKNAASADAETMQVGYSTGYVKIDTGSECPTALYNQGVTSAERAVKTFDISKVSSIYVHAICNRASTLYAVNVYNIWLE
jgi:hypothetical protein